jgi:hypothetical protein
VAENGYTQLPPSADRSQMRWEINEQLVSPEIALQLRRNQLMAHPLGLFPGTPPETGGWAVVFQFTPEYLDRSRARDDTADAPAGGRAVYVRTAPSSMQATMAHAEVRLDAVTVRLPSPEETAAACANSLAHER